MILSQKKIDKEVINNPNLSLNISNNKEYEIEKIKNRAV